MHFIVPQHNILTKVDEYLEHGNYGHNDLACGGEVRSTIVDRDVAVRIGGRAGNRHVLFGVYREEKERRGDERAEEQEDGHRRVRLDIPPVPCDRPDEPVWGAVSIA